jgi:hypothetical protein
MDITPILVMVAITTIQIKSPRNTKKLTTIRTAFNATGMGVNMMIDWGKYMKPLVD